MSSRKVVKRSKKRSKQRVAKKRVAKKVPRRDKKGRFAKRGGRKKVASRKHRKRDSKGRFLKKPSRDEKGRFIGKMPRGGPEKAKWIFEKHGEVKEDLGTAMDMKAEGDVTQDEFLNIVRGLGLSEHEAYTMFHY